MRANVIRIINRSFLLIKRISRFTELITVIADRSRLTRDDLKILINLICRTRPVDYTYLLLIKDKNSPNKRISYKIKAIVAFVLHMLYAVSGKEIQATS